MTPAEYDRWMDTRCALRAMVDAFKPFRSKPMGAPNSDARQEQEMQIAAYDYAVTVLSLPVKPSTTCVVAMTDHRLTTKLDVAERQKQ